MIAKYYHRISSYYILYNFLKQNYIKTYDGSIKLVHDKYMQIDIMTSIGHYREITFCYTITKGNINQLKFKILWEEH